MRKQKTKAEELWKTFFSNLASRRWCISCVSYGTSTLQRCLFAYYMKFNPDIALLESRDLSDSNEAPRAKSKKLNHRV